MKSLVVLLAVVLCVTGGRVQAQNSLRDAVRRGGALGAATLGATDDVVVTSETTLASDDGNLQPDQKVTGFSVTDDSQHLVVYINKGRPDLRVKTLWTMVKAGDRENERIGELVIDGKTLKPGTRSLDFRLHNKWGFPAGEYKIDVLLDDKPAKTVTYQVTGLPVDPNGAVGLTPKTSLAKDDGHRVTGFAAADTPQHLLVYLNQVTPDTRVKTVWTLVHASGMENRALWERELTGKALAPGDPPVFDFSLNNEGGFPEGSYQIAVLVNGQPAKTFAYQVTK